MDNHPLRALSERYLSNKNISSSTLKSYKIAFKHYISHLKERHIMYAKTSDVIKYREHKRRSGHSTEYIYIQISALKGFYHYLSINQKNLCLPVTYAYDIMVSIKNERIKHRIKKPILTKEQAKHMIIHTKELRKYIWHYRDHAIIYVMMTSGLRAIEIIHAKREDYKRVDSKQCLYVQREGEKTDAEFVNLSKGARDALNDYLNKRRDNNPYLFMSHRKVSDKGHLSTTFFKDMFKRLLKECGLEHSGITPHCLRHTAAFMNLLRGGSLEATKGLMRHVNIKSTLVYQDHINRMKDDSEAQIESFILKEEASISYDDFIAYLES